MIIERITGPLPDWAHRQNPILKYKLQSSEGVSLRGRILRSFGIVFILLALGFGGYIIATDGFSRPAGQNMTDTANAILFYPMVIIQLMLSIAALALTIGAVGEEKRHRTWDNLRATTNGTALTFKTRWVSVFYRLRGPLGLITILRFFLIGGILWDLTAFQGKYLGLLTGGVVPNIPLSVGAIPFAIPVAALMLSLFLTASLLLPFTTIALDAALGLYLSTLFQQRVYSLIVQFCIFVLRIMIISGLVWFGTGYLEGAFNPGASGAWLMIFSFSALADWGILLLHLGSAGEIWATIPYGLFIGPSLIVFLLLQAFTSSILLRLSIRMAEHRG